DTLNTAIQVYDTKGTAHTLSLTFQKQTDGTWNLTGSLAPSDGTLTTSTVTGIAFNSNGSFRQVNGSGILVAQFAGLPNAQPISLNFGSINGFNGLTEFGSPSTASATGQDGYAASFLTSTSLALDGTLDGIFTNGQVLPIAQ